MPLLFTLTDFTHSGVSIFNFEHVKGWMDVSRIVNAER